MWLAAALITGLFFGMNNSLFKWSSTRGLSKINIQFFFYLGAFVLTAIYVLATHSFHFTIWSVVLGALIGILNTNGNLEMTRAFESGPASLTSPVIASNAVFPVLAAGLIFHEHILLVNWLGILFMMVSVIVIQYSPNSQHNGHHWQWLLHVTLAVLSFGILGILMKTSSFLHVSSSDMLVAMYGGGTVYLAFKLGRDKPNRHEIRVGLVVAVLSTVAYSCYFYALQTGIASIIFPVVSLNCVIVVLSGRYLFQERIRLHQMWGIFTALVGLVLTKL
ncbi:EamA family transporter [Alicyclobacillus ferrooxydans]|uniref:EamA domain-containing protein n=1 Tax=Alicyclobacillus ferrooxydans TaxID=471514 RepID=A0A0P9CR25_9BACL|nr:EamA family transporter [Alicyclobacillus ferrooxydans]KPV41807.1 hypothetical protein AN477_20470 [Alicyclobacillus ferrooxydans]